MFYYLKKSFILAFSFILFGCHSVFADESKIKTSYRWGRGFNLPSAYLNIGGYSNLVYQNLKQQGNRVGLDDLSLFITWNPFSKLHFFSELEFEDAFDSQKGIHFSDKTFLVERLYADYLVNETYQIRIGKFLTPVGIWNNIHAAPLVWTTTRPLITEASVFAAHTSGIQFTSKFIIDDHNLLISIYADDSHHLDPHKNRVSFKNALGTRVSVEVFSHVKLGFSYITYKNHTIVGYSDRNHLFGGDFLWKQQGYEIQAEFAYRHGGKQLGKETGLYLQTVLPLIHHVYAVGRYEYINGTHSENAITETGTYHLGIAGLAWRPYSPLVIKTEYRFGGGGSLIAPNGFFMSISTFF